ncbi:hypothetical protein [Deinococcus sp. UR1]|uniref:hypothetical protein n=1 Tax=Deinococcus sp. UR1 TaxID=1704277 RepID=UPI0006DC02BE|nr:hypothetical protein [Deinococcus sp. UR1]PIH00319.1 hypothetical protein AMD26_001750 [Deinococcus sp. UR1]
MTHMSSPLIRSTLFLVSICSLSIANAAPLQLQGVATGVNQELVFTAGSDGAYQGTVTADGTFQVTLPDVAKSYVRSLDIMVTEGHTNCLKSNQQDKEAWFSDLSTFRLSSKGKIDDSWTLVAGVNTALKGMDLGYFVRFIYASADVNIDIASSCQVENGVLFSGTARLSLKQGWNLVLKTVSEYSANKSKVRAVAFTNLPEYFSLAWNVLHF